MRWRHSSHLACTLCRAPRGHLLMSGHAPWAFPSSGMWDSREYPKNLSAHQGQANRTLDISHERRPWGEPLPPPPVHHNPNPPVERTSSKLIVCDNPGWSDGAPGFTGIETQFGAHCADRMNIRKWANSIQIPQASTNLKISFFSGRHEAKFRPCFDIKTGASLP